MYSKYYKLKKPQMTVLLKLTEEFLYTCGTCFQDALYYDDEYKAVYENVYVRANLTCSGNIEIPYYSAGNDPICIYCGAEDRLKICRGKYPICEPCVEKKLLPVDE